MLVSCLGPRLGGEIMGLRGLSMGLRGLIWVVQELIWGLRGLILSSRDQISGPSRLDEGLRPLKGGGRTEGRTDGRTDGRMEIHPCVLQDIGPLWALPKKRMLSNIGIS